jgi:hypothetical protein
MAAVAFAAFPPARAAAQSRPVAYVQATVVEPNAAAGSLGFVTAGGRSRTARASGSALASLSRLQPGDEAILTLEGPADRPVVTAVKVSRVVPPPPPPETLASPYAWTQTMVPSRPSWPNPYSRINPGLPMRPARAPRGRAGALTVVPAGLSVGSGQTPAPPSAAPAVAATTPPATPSTVDALRARGEREFEAAVARLAAEARSADSATIQAGMRAATEAARSAWVLPGTMSDIRRRHGMDWSGWDR